MRFRGRITDLLSVRQFAQLLQVLSKCSSQFVLRISEECLIFVLSEKDVRTNGATAWCVVPKDAYFSDYKMEGISPPHDNEIFLEINSEMLAIKLSSLKSSNSVVSIKIKLTNKVTPCLSFEIESETQKSNTVCLHDIPVDIVTRPHWRDYQETELPPFDISIDMPDLKLVRTALERIIRCGPRISATASSEGNVVFTIDSYTVNSSVKFSDLRVMKDDDNPQDGGRASLSSKSRSKSARASKPSEANGNQEAAQYFTVEVDTKILMQLLPSEDLKPDNFLLSILDGHMLHLFYICGEITLQYCIPGIA